MTGADTWEEGERYEQYIGRWSRQVAARFLDWLDVVAGRRWLDVGCGTGALSTEILARAAPSSVVGVEPSEGFLATAEKALHGRMILRRGSATEIPLDEASVDVTVSGLVLNFVPQGRAAVQEMARVTAPGGTVAAYVWDYGAGMEIIRHFWDAAVDLDTSAARHDEGLRFPVCRPEGLTQLFTTAGLQDTQVTAIEIATPFASFDEYWRPVLGGQGPAPAYVMALDERARTRLRDRLRASLPVQRDGSIALSARAWAVRGTTAR